MTGECHVCGVRRACGGSKNKTPNARHQLAPCCSGGDEFLKLLGPPEQAEGREGGAPHAGHVPPAAVRQSAPRCQSLSAGGQASNAAAEECPAAADRAAALGAPGQDRPQQ
jgi:hypothetical protein